MIQKKKFADAISADISVVEELLNTESFADSVYRNYGGNSFAKKNTSKGSGWIRVMKVTDGTSFLVNLSKKWGSMEPESFLLYVKKAKQDIIKQIAGKTDGNFISKVRIATYADGNSYFEEYYKEVSSTGNNELWNSFSCVCLADKSNYVGTYVIEEPTEVLVETEIISMS